MTKPKPPIKEIDTTSIRNLRDFALMRVAAIDLPVLRDDDWFKRELEELRVEIAAL